MKQSALFIKTQKQVNKEEVSRNAELLLRGGYIDKLMAGVYTILPLGLRVLNKIENIIREEINAIDGQEIYMPTLQPKENWETTGRWNSMDDLIKVKKEDKEFALGPTHEEIVTPLAKKFINSYKDLPVYFYQFQNKFRYEKRAKSGLLRGREFIMKDLYSFHADQADLDAYYDKAKEAYKKIFARCGLGDRTYVTYASGGSFSKYSHEFQTLTEAGEDTIYVCEHCKVAINKEIIDDLKSTCPECGNTELKTEKAIEVGNIFKLQNKFSDAFEVNFTDREGKEQTAIMGCYGIGLQRLMGTIVEASNDDKGIIWPKAVAPFQIHLVALNLKSDEEQKQAEQIYQDLNKKFEVLYDDRDVSTGEKLNDADLLGLPTRIIISAKTLAQNSVELKERTETESQLVLIDALLQELK